jgi:hypothetical protein
MYWRYSCSASSIVGERGDGGREDLFFGTLIEKSLGLSGEELLLEFFFDFVGVFVLTGFSGILGSSGEELLVGFFLDLVGLFDLFLMGLFGV